MRVSFGTKAETLERLEPLLQSARVLPQIRFTTAQWLSDAKAVLEKLSAQPWATQPLIVRSSGLCEDAANQSLAGHFLSVANVAFGPQLNSAVEAVIGSFSAESEQDQIFIQPMLCGVSLSGVGFSRDPRNAGHYLVINYDDQSGTTDSITAGRSNNLKTCYLQKAAPTDQTQPLHPVQQLLSELEALFEQDALDIEFAIADGQLYLLQVRPLVLTEAASLDCPQQRQVLQAIGRRFDQLNQPHPYLHGDRSVFGVMPDWNPAEIIGIRPRPLALSSYKALITDSVWAYQRNNYGYRNLRSFPLLIDFAGLPYIDVRVSFNSFIPADIEPLLAERLVNHYIERLSTQPNHHDKVEFEVIYSCYTLDLDQRLQQLRQYGFDDQDCDTLSQSLRDLTNRIIHQQGLWSADIEKLERLEQRQQTVMGSELEPLEKIYWLLEDCKRYGTLPFAGLARAGFIAVQLLQSMVNTGVLRQQDYQRFMASLDTVSSQLGEDLKQLERSQFLTTYGHLRPGTYDITSPRYDAAPERYFQPPNLDAQQAEPSQTDEADFSLSLEQMNRLEQLLADHQISHGVISLFNFIKGAIEGRERAKFIFTRSLSDAFELLAELGARYNISRDELSYVDIELIPKLYGSCLDIEQSLRQSINEGKARYAVTRQINLPPLITRREDIDRFELPVNEPNFITLRSAAGAVVDNQTDPAQLRGKILMIPSADPGYDWIFSHQIAGFITMYGGVNSHMAIRAGELGIPAVIGAGESLYRGWSQAHSLEIDCAKQSVVVLQ